MPSRVDTCPHCGHHVESSEEFCRACGAWLVGGHTWPAPPRPIPDAPPRESLYDTDDEPVPLPVAAPPQASLQDVAGRSTLLLLTLALIGVWIWAERMIVTRDDWAYWDHTWIAAALLTLLLAAWWLRDAVLRGRRDGWDRAWRFWEPPGTWSGRPG